jgi:hypothetical protein
MQHFCQRVLLFRTEKDALPPTDGEDIVLSKLVKGSSHKKSLEIINHALGGLALSLARRC